MKKVLILLTLFIYSISVNANFDLKSCQNEYFNDCPSYSIGKVLKDEEIKNFIDYNKVPDWKKEEGYDYSQKFFMIGDNHALLFSGGLDNYNEIVLNSLKYSSILPYNFKKDDIIIYGTSQYLEKNNIKENYILDLNSEKSYFKDSQIFMGKNEYEYIMNGYEGNFLFNDNFGGFEKIYCEDDIIKIYNIKNKPESLNLTFDSITKPKLELGYNLKNLEKDLQVLAPCSKFNELFGLENNNQEKIQNQEIELKEEIKQKSWFEKIVDFIKSIFSKIF